MSLDAASEAASRQRADLLLIVILEDSRRATTPAAQRHHLALQARIEAQDTETLRYLSDSWRSLVAPGAQRGIANPTTPPLSTVVAPEQEKSYQRVQAIAQHVFGTSQAQPR